MSESTAATESGSAGFAPEGPAGQPAAEAPRSLPRPRGPSWSTIALGLVCLVVAGGALLIEFTELTLEWDRTGPLALVGLGLLLVLVGLAALVRRSDDEHDE